jgi:hypothetical protein
MPLSHAAVWCTCLLGLASVAACSAIEPEVGPSQESCGVSPIGPASTAVSGGYGSSPSGGNSASSALPPSRYCAPDAGGPCDVCESTYCCATRMACYMDPVCVCADNAMDECQDAAKSADQVSACEDAFSARGTVEQARMTCLNAWCATVCGAP